MDVRLRKRLRLVKWGMLAVALVVATTVKLSQSLLLVVLVCAAVVFALVVALGRYRRSRGRR